MHLRWISTPSSNMNCLKSANTAHEAYIKTIRKTEKGVAYEFVGGCILRHYSGLDGIFARIQFGAFGACAHVLRHDERGDLSVF